MSSEYLHPSARHLREQADPAAVQRVEHRIVARRRRRTQRRFYGAIALAVGSLSLTWGGMELGQHHRSEVSTQTVVFLEDGSSLSPGARVASPAPTELRLDDGATIALDKDTALRVERSEVDLVQWALETGRVEFAQNEGYMRQHRVRSPHASITMLASRCKVTVTAEQTVVFAYRGRVVVEPVQTKPTHPPSPAARAARHRLKPIVLQAGESIEVPARPVSVEAASAPAREEKRAVPRRPTMSDAKRPLARPKAPSSAMRREPSRSPQANKPPDAGAGPADPAEAAQDSSPSTPSGPTLAAADRAMRQEQFEEAASILEAVLQSRPDGEEAPFAAFSLGNVLADHLGRPIAARAAFKKALASSKLPAALKAIARRRIETLSGARWMDQQ